MNYRHAFHAGNFADLAKHAALGLLLDRLLAGSAPLQVVDTHAGAGRYDLAGAMALKSGEAEAGIARLMADGQAPQVFDTLKAAVRGMNGSGPILHYPGSPLLTVQRLRKGDRYSGAELHPDDFAALDQVLAPWRPAAAARLTDGFALAAEAAGQGSGPLLVLIDPPYERADDYQQAAQAAGLVLRRNSQAVVAIWTPLKDLETFDSFIRRLEEAARGPVLVAETRLSRLDNPLKMNGCAMVFLNAPEGLHGQLQSAGEWIAGQLGGAGAEARVWSCGA